MSKYINTTQTGDSLFYDNSTSNLNAETVRDAIDEISHLNNITGEPTGFPNRVDSSISFVDGTRTFTVQPSATSFDYYIKGVKYTVSSPLSIVIPNTSGTYFIYLNDSGSLAYLTAFSPSLLRDYAYVANVYWSVTQAKSLGLGDERHGLTMDYATHSYLHKYVGARTSANDFAIGNFILSGPGSSDSEASASFENGILTDEDVEHTIVHSATPSANYEQILNTVAKLPMFRREGASGEWLLDTATDYLVRPGTSHIQYNLDTAGTWSSVDAGEGNTIAMWVFATNFVSEPIRLVLGQRTDATLVDAQNNNTYESLNLSNLPGQEFKVLYRLLFKTSTTYTNSLKVRLLEIKDLRKTIDQGQIVINSTDHSQLTGLGNDDHLQYIRTDGTRSFTGDQSFGGNDLINVGTVNSVVVEAHSSRHLPSGADPLTTGTPNTIGTTNNTGNSDDFARGNHSHDHGNQTTPSHHAVATTSANGFMSSADKTKLDGISGTRIFKSGTIAAGSFTGIPRTATVTFATAMPNTNYSISVLGVNSRSWNFQSKTVNGFVINSNSITALSGEVTWQCISHGETVE